MFEFDLDRILSIAREAVERRKGEEQDGFVECADYNEYLRVLICEGKLDPVDECRCMKEICEILISPANEPKHRYHCVNIGQKAYFYPLYK